MNPEEQPSNRTGPGEANTAQQGPQASGHVPSYLPPYISQELSLPHRPGQEAGAREDTQAEQVQVESRRKPLLNTNQGNVAAGLDGVVRATSTCFQNLAGAALQLPQTATLAAVVIETLRTCVGFLRGAHTKALPSRAQLGLMGGSLVLCAAALAMLLEAREKKAS